MKPEVFFYFTKKLPVFLCLFLALPAFADELSPAWLALGHYHKNFFGGWQSDAEGLFLDPDGDHDPAKELATTVKEFREYPETMCRFPARKIFLEKNNYSFPVVKCEAYDRWRTAIDTKSLELIYAAAFINSPASMYGHTMLKFPREGKTKGNPLLDYVLSFGADTGGAGGLSYMVKGLSGAFPGYYTTAPFYLKVKEYNQVENRDFWIYPIDLKPTEFQLLLAHVWELREIKFRYYFLRKNCSYFLLELLSVARPDLQLTKHFPFWSIPVDTIRVLKANGLLGKGERRASRYNRLLAARKNLSAAEGDAAKALVKEGVEKAALSPAALNAAYEYYRYETGAGNHLSIAEEANGDTILRLINNQKSPLPEILLDAESPPEEGHKSAKVFAGIGMDRVHSFYSFGYRGALHSQLDNTAGYEPASELSMGDFYGRVEAGHIFLERADILRIRSTPDFDTWAPKASWNMSLGTKRAKDLPCSDWHCTYGNLDGGAGLTLPIFFSSLSVFGNLSNDAGAPFDKGYRIGFGPSLVWNTPFFSFWHEQLEYDKRFHIAGDTRDLNDIKLTESFNWHTNYEFQLQGEVAHAYGEMSASLHYLF